MTSKGSPVKHTNPSHPPVGGDARHPPAGDYDGVPACGAAAGPPARAEPPTDGHERQDLFVVCRAREFKRCLEAMVCVIKFGFIISTWMPFSGCFMRS